MSSVKTYSAISLCSYLTAMLKDGDCGVVHSVYNRVCNIEFPNMPIVALLSNRGDLRPNGCLIDIRDFLETNISQGDIAIFKNGCISVGNVSISIENTPIIDLSRKIISDKLLTSNINDNLDKLREFILNRSKKEGLSVLIPKIDALFHREPINYHNLTPTLISDFLWGRIPNFINAVSMQSDINRYAQMIWGAGIGLTPSSDDMLTGFIGAYIYGSSYQGGSENDIHADTAEMCRGIIDKTVRISGEIVEFASQGFMTELLHIASSGLFYEYAGNITEIWDKILLYGQTSGEDTITGLYLGGCFIVNRTIS